MKKIITTKNVELFGYKNSIPTGSVIEVIKSLKTVYKGLWYSCLGSYIVSIPKNSCKTYKG